MEPWESCAGVVHRRSAPVAVDATVRFWMSPAGPCRTYVEIASLLASGDAAMNPIGAVSGGIGSSVNVALATGQLAKFGEQCITLGIRDGVIWCGASALGGCTADRDLARGPAAPGQELIEDHLPDVEFRMVQVADLVPSGVRADQSLPACRAGRRGPLWASRPAGASRRWPGPRSRSWTAPSARPPRPAPARCRKRSWRRSARFGKTSRRSRSWLPTPRACATSALTPGHSRPQNEPGRCGG